MAKRLNARAAAAKISWQIIDKGQSLDAALSDYFDQISDDDRSLIQELVYGICRWYGELDQLAASLLEKPIRNKDRVVHYVLLVGLYQLKHLETAPHAAVSETVAACQQLQKGWAKNLINGCLRRWQRDGEQWQISADEAHRLTHPAWLLTKIEQHWPDHSLDILAANNARPPMILRVNSAINTRDNYLASLADANIEAEADTRSADAIHLLRPTPVTKLPNFADGHVSVQDIAAQIAADILAPRDNQTVLDACAAPGGKTAHLLERCKNAIAMDALDVSPNRVLRLRDTLARLHLNANIYCADATQAPSWPVPDKGYDHVLIDAPCSGTGVIRRHPDIKHHRRDDDIDALNLIQGKLLTQLWALTKVGGQMLYMTCSILPEENEQQIQTFLTTQPNAEVQVIDHPDALQREVGLQTLPGVHNMDGFYYCLLRKMAP